MNIAIIGGGISGLCTALESANRGANVTLYERGEIMKGTSNASTKLLHGGLRYLENLEFGLVRESLKERAWWLKNVPSLAKPIELHLPIYKNLLRSKYKYKIGLWLYDQLAGKNNIKKHKWLSRSLFVEKNKGLNSELLDGGFVFYDGQMNDYELGIWVAEKAKSLGVKIKEYHEISNISTDGKFTFLNKKNNNGDDSKLFDHVIIAAGSYTEQLLVKSNITPNYKINHIRGSHILIDRHIDKGYFFEYPNQKRIFFVLPYKNQTLIGTTEEIQKLSDPVSCSNKEKNYLIKGYNHYFCDKICLNDIVSQFAGLRPLISSKKKYSNSSREYAIQKNNKVISIYGGKWTTSRALARQICNQINLNK